MIRQIGRLILFLLAKLWALFCKYPGASLGIIIGGIIGFVLSIFMTKHGFPGWILPVQTVMWAVCMAPIVKNYLDKLTK